MLFPNIARYAQSAREITAALLVVFNITILLVNILVIVAVFRNPWLRRSFKHIFVVNLAICDLIVGLFICPVYTHVTLHGEEGLPCSTINALRFFTVSLVPSIATLALFVINMDYIFKLTWYYYASAKHNARIFFTLLLMPWILTFIIMIPLYFDATTSKRLDGSPLCVRELKSYSTSSVAFITLSFFPQAILVFVSFMVAGILYLFSRRYTGLDVAGERVRAPVDLVLASFVTILFLVPFFILLSPVGKTGCDSRDECHALSWVAIIGFWLYFAKSFTVPLCWLFCRDLRHGIANIADCSLR